MVRVEMASLEEYQLDKCVDWIEQGKYKNVALQFCQWQVKDSPKVIKYLKQKASSENDYFVIISSACGVDYLSPLHLGVNVVDAIIHFGDTCLAPLPETVKEIPVLFIFGEHLDENAIDFVKNSLQNANVNKESLILYDNRFLMLIKQLINQQVIREENCAKLISFSQLWSFSESFADFICESEKVSFKLGQFALLRKISEYERVYYIGSRVSLVYRVESINGVVHINPNSETVTNIKHMNEISKRISLIEKLRKPNLHIGAIFTNCYSSVEKYQLRMKQLTLKLNHKLSLLSLVQSTDECKLGNFSDFDAIVIITECFCTNLIDNIKLHIPMLTFAEYEVAAGARESYGGHIWELTETDSEEHLMPNENNQIIEADVLAAHTWYGLSFAGETQDASVVKEGQKGVASMYQDEGK